MLAGPTFEALRFARHALARFDRQPLIADRAHIIGAGRRHGSVGVQGDGSDGKRAHGEALGLGYQAMLQFNPRLIYCSISALGQGGPRRAQTAYDHVIQATSGIMASTGTEEVNP